MTAPDHEHQHIEAAPLPGKKTPVWDRKDPFEQGNTFSVAHGAGSTKLVSERTAEVRHDLISSYQWLTESDSVAIDLLCSAQARYELLSEYMWGIVEGAIERAPQGRPPKRGKAEATTGVEAVPAYIWTEITKLEKNISDMANRLGLDPAGRAAIFKDFGWAKALAGQSMGKLVEMGGGLRNKRLGRGEASEGPSEETAS
jgi:hypothetical protein